MSNNQNINTNQQNNNNTLSPILSSLKESWSTKAKQFSLSRIGTFFTSKKKRMNNIDIDKIKLWLRDPQKYQSELIDLSDSLYAPEGLYKTLVNLTTNMATLDNYLQPDYSTMQKLKEEIEKIPKPKVKIDPETQLVLEDSEEQIKYQDEINKILKNFNNEFSTVKQYIDNIDIKKTGRRIIESLVRYGGYCGFEKNDGKFPYLWDLPIKYVRLYSISNGQYRAEFNFKYFDELSRDTELIDFEWDRFPLEFKVLYNTYKTNPNRLRYPEWQPLPSEKVCCIKLGGDSETFFLPLFSQLFTELFLLNDLIDEEIESSRDDKIKLINIEFPNENGVPLVEPDVVSSWVSVVAQGVPSSVCVTGSPFPLREIPFKSIQNEKTGLIEFAKSMAYMQAGANPLLLGGSSTNSSVGVNQNLIYIQSLVFSMLDKIQSWFNYRISNVNLRKKYTFKLNIWKITWYNQQEEFDREYKLTSIGGSLNILTSMAGHNSDSYNATLQYENLTKSKDNWIAPRNMNQIGNQDDKGGRQKLDDSQISDNGIVSRDKENNNR